uniref:Transcriptional regulator ATRX n=1 Tax=Anopheles funestus TaxID=62324 RepID=A0A182RAT7_ANOFN
MSTTAEEPDLFNDVEIMEVGDFTESDENYVSVELRSDDEDDERVILDTHEFSSPKSLGSGEFESIPVETSPYVINSSAQSNRFLSDHEYLNDSTSAPVFEAATTERIASQVENTSRERFCVPYVEDLDMQDLFNKDNAPDGTAVDNEASDEEMVYEPFEIKIEIGEPQIQETIVETEYIGNEIIASDLHESEVESEDACNIILQSLHNSFTQHETENRSLLDNDHSYTTTNYIAPQFSDQEDLLSDNDENKVRKLINLSKKLACEDDVTTTCAKKTVEQIDKTVKSLLYRSKKAHNSVHEIERPAAEGKCSPIVNGDSPDKLSVLLSANCSERFEDDGALPSSGDTLHDQMPKGFESDTDCTKGATGTDRTATEFNELISLGNKFSKHCERWIEQTKSKKNLETVSNFSELGQLLQKINRQSGQIPMARQCSLNSNVGRAMCKVETGVQTDNTKNYKHMQRTLNEKSKQKLLDSLSNSSSDQSDSGGSIMARSSDSDRDGDEMMQEFVRRNRRLQKSAKDKRKNSAVGDIGKERTAGSKKRTEQIYSDSSVDEEKHSEREGERVDGDENLLDDVLSGVDDIISDCPDVMGVMQDYFEEAEERQGRDELSPKQSKPSSDAQLSKDVCTKQIDKVSGTKHFKDMTESEREEYEDLQIERLCNISNLVVCRNASSVVSANTQNTAKAKDAKEHLKKKKEENSMEQFLNDENGTDNTIPLEPHSEESSESEKDVVETEEQFLQKCNDNVKLQMLNQSSSSEETTHDDSLDDRTDNTSDDSMHKGSDDEASNESSGSLVETFLKRHSDKITQKNEKKKRTMDEISDLENSNSQLLTNGQGDSPGNVAAAGEDSSGKDISTAKQPGEAKKQYRMELANPKDKELFSNDLFDDSRSDTSDKKPRKKRKRMGARKERLSDSELQSSSDESDVGVANVLIKKRQRKRKAPPTAELPDSSPPTTATSSKDDKSGDGVVTSITESNVTTKKHTISSTDSLEKTSSPAPGLQSASSATERPAKTKASKDGQDCISLSSDSSDDAELISADLDEGKTAPDKEPKRRTRHMLTNDELAEETKKAQKEEEGRTARLKKKQEQLKKCLATYKPGPGESELVLDYDSLRRQAISVHPDIVKLLKPHQVEGIQFMYDNTYGSIDALPKHPGSGCVLAHCMGLGKTLQMITLLHTVMRYPQLMTNRVLVICPKSTVMNWKEEISRWQGTIHTGYQMRVYCFPDVCTQNDKISVLKRWYSCKSPNCGVMLIGYEAFRALINYERRKGSERMRSAKLELIKEYLLNPGADLVICDEGHQIKNKRSAISEAVSKIHTKRRIMLTGTPIQNNLKEYYCMVNFIKPSFLGSDKEFSNLYANPIKNGQCKDSDHQAIKIMKQRSYVLHNKLSKFVQRKEASVLKEFLPEKFEYVLFIPLTPVQEKLYQVFLQMNEYTSNDITGEPGRTKKFKLIADYTSLRKIWTHPKVLEKAWELANLEKNRKDAIRKTATPDTDDEAPDDINDIASGQLSVTNDWWRQYLETADLESLFPSNKLWIMFEILKQSNERGEKVLIFTAFVSVLNMVEHFMAKIHNQSADPQQADEYGYSAFKGPWRRGRDYFRLDGKTPKTDRHQMITSFNDPLNTVTKCFLISAKAGGQGINLTGASRVIILDTSWNPSNDQQNIFRIYRLGQKRKCYVYRLIAVGTMEEKVYSRSVTKQALSYRVVDEQQIDRHYSYGELAELYTLTKLSEMTRETPILPADDILASLLRTFSNKVIKYHEHDSLLENKPEQDLSEEEKKEAWAAYEREIQNNENRSYLSQFGALGATSSSMFGASQYAASLASYYNSLGYGGMPSMPGMPVGGGDMYRNDFSSYSNSINRPLYMQYSGQPSYTSMLSDPAYTSALAKMFNNFPMSGTTGMDYGMPSLQSHSSPIGNGQSMLPPVGPTVNQAGSSGKGYGSAGVLASMLNYYTGKATASSSGLPPSSLGALGQSQLSSAASSSLGDIAAQHSTSNSSNPMSHYNTLKQMCDYAQSNLSLLPSNAVQPATPAGLTISNIASLHKSSPQSTGNPNASGGGFDSAKSIFNRLSEQMAISSISSAGVSSPFSPRNVPLLSPTLDNQSRNNIGHIPITSPSIQSLTATNTASSAMATVTTASSQSASAPTSAIGQGVQKHTKQTTASTGRSTVDNVIETMRSNSTASVLRSTSSTVVNAGAATVIPSDEEDDVSRIEAIPPKTSNPPDKRVTGTNFGITYNKPQNNSTPPNPSSATGIGKDLFKNLKTLSNNVPQQHTKSIAKPSINPSRVQLDRTTSALSSLGTATVPQSLTKTVPVKPNQSLPTVNLTPPLKKHTNVNKSASMARSPLTVQTLIPTSKVTLPATNTSTSTPSPMQIVRSGNATQRTAETSISISTTMPKSSMAITVKSQPATTAGVVPSTNTSTTTATVAKTVQKPVLVGASQQGKTSNALQPSMGGVQTLPSRAFSNTTITQVKSAAAAIPKPRPESRPMTLTMTAIKTPLTMTSNTGPKMVKNPISAITMAKVDQKSPTPTISKEATSRSGPQRPINVFQKTNIAPATLLSTASMTGKLNNATGIGTTTTRLSSSVPLQLPTVKTSSGVTTPATTTNQSVLVTRPSAVTSVMARPTTIISRPGKSPITMNATRTSISAAKTGLTNIMTTATAQHPGSSRISVANSLPSTTMTIIPTANVTTTAGLQKLTGSGGVPTSSALTSTVIPSTSTVGMQRTGGSPTTSTMTVIPAANVSGMSYNYKDVARKDLVIHKAVASPTMRRILPTTLGSQQTTIKPFISATPSRTVLKPNVPAGNIIRAGTGTTTTTTPSNITGVQTAPNCVFIRKRGLDSTTMDSSKAKNVPSSIFEQQLKGSSSNAANSIESGASSIKRARREQTNINPPVITSTSLASYGITNRICGGLVVKTKALPQMKANKKGDPTEVVVLE